MKCVCGYERVEAWRDDQKDIGDEDFIWLDQIHPKAKNKNRGYYEPEYCDVSLYMCPKCGTIRGEI